MSVLRLGQYTRVLAITACCCSRYHRVPRNHEEEDISEHLKTLNLPRDCDQEQLRSAFIDMVKKYHPDSGSPCADAEKFKQIELSYRKIQEKFSRCRWKASEGEGEYGLYYEENESENDNNKHTVPQHRQYLNFEGIGFGTPSQRERQYQKHRVQRATDNVYEHRIGKLTYGYEDHLVAKDKRAAKKIKTRYGIDRVVEDLIQESMARGEFENLAGKGKPLQSHVVYNPYVDFVTHKMNEVLIDNGFAPEWVSLQKEIRIAEDNILSSLLKERKLLGPYPLSQVEENQWCKVLYDLKSSVSELNKQINNYNLVVPLLNKQRLLFNLEKEAKKILQDGVSCNQDNLTSVHGKEIPDKQKGFLNYLTLLFRQ